MGCGGNCECECGGAGKPAREQYIVTSPTPGSGGDITPGGGPAKSPTSITPGGGPKPAPTSITPGGGDEPDATVVVPPDADTTGGGTNTPAVTGGDISGQSVIPPDSTDSTGTGAEIRPPSHPGEVTGKSARPPAPGGTGLTPSEPVKGKGTGEEQMCTCTCECVPIPIAELGGPDAVPPGGRGGGGGGGGPPGGGGGGGATTGGGGPTSGGGGGGGGRTGGPVTHDVPIAVAGFVPYGGTAISAPGAGLGSVIAPPPGTSVGYSPGVDAPSAAARHGSADRRSTLA